MTLFTCTILVPLAPIKVVSEIMPATYTSSAGLRITLRMPLETVHTHVEINVSSTFDNFTNTRYLERLFHTLRGNSHYGNKTYIL